MTTEPMRLEVNPRLSNTAEQNRDLVIRQLVDGGFSTHQIDRFLDTLRRMESDDSVIAPLTNALLAVDVTVQWLY
ncbi:hypothetical protein AB6813_00065 [bacterium RCC_150]